MIDQSVMRMIDWAYLGQYALLLANVFFLLAAIIPLLIGKAGGLFQGKVQSAFNLSTKSQDDSDRWVLWSFVVGFLHLAVAMLLLIICLLSDDFTVRYVVENSNTALPWYYKISSAWAGHEGSLLLWVLLMAFWGILYIVFSKGEGKASSIRWLSLVVIGFLLFLLLTSSPFERVLPQFPAQGRDLNPLLQDVGLIVHPPMLYLGYVGFVIPFVLAVSGLWTRSIDRHWVRQLIPWIALPLGCLTMGIALGSRWAYYELGWGGWWFWDPVENAALMPWLSGIALFHCALMAKSKERLLHWLLILVFLTFLLSLMGAFLVRSGLLSSVHSFAQSPSRGMVILTLIAVFVGGALWLYARRADEIYRWSTRSLQAAGRDHAAKNLKARENNRLLLVLLANVLWMTLLAVVMIGTLFPLIAAAANWGNYSVGEPYYHQLLLPIAIALLLLMGFASINSVWQRSSTTKRVFGLQIDVYRYARLTGVLMVIISLSLAFWLGFESDSVRLVLTLTLIIWCALQLLGAWLKNTRITIKFMAMQVAHLGFLVLALGIVWVSHRELEYEAVLYPNQPIELADMRLELLGSSQQAQANYISLQATLQIDTPSEQLILTPEKRWYPARDTVMSEAAIHASLWRDIYLVLGEPVDEQAGAWSVKLFYKPLIALIWIGAGLMTLGLVMSLLSRVMERLKRRFIADRYTNNLDEWP